MEIIWDFFKNYLKQKQQQQHKSVSINEILDVNTFVLCVTQIAEFIELEPKSHGIGIFLRFFSLKLISFVLKTEKKQKKKNILR